jgi:hypothetical protein
VHLIEKPEDSALGLLPCGVEHVTGSGEYDFYLVIAIFKPSQPLGQINCAANPDSFDSGYGFYVDAPATRLPSGGEQTTLLDLVAFP